MVPAAAAALVAWVAENSAWLVGLATVAASSAVVLLAAGLTVAATVAALLVAAMVAVAAVAVCLWAAGSSHCQVAAVTQSLVRVAPVALASVEMVLVVARG